MLEPTDDVRFVIVVSTVAPNRNWFLLVTRDEFIVVRTGLWRLRPVVVSRRLPRTVLRPRITLTRRRTIELRGVDYYVSRLQLGELHAQNDDYLAGNASDAAPAPVLPVPRARAAPVSRAVRRHRPRRPARSVEYDQELAELHEIVRELRDGLADGDRAGALR